jgi:DNA-binding CsgD family transcriptional regulator/PAS domain-containing protein
MQKISQQKVLDLIGSLYDIAHQASAEAWTAFYAEMAELLDCGPGGIWLSFPQVGKFEFVCHNLDLKGLAEYYDGYEETSPFRGRLMALRPGDSFERRREMPDEDWVKTEFYKDYLARYDVFNFRHQALFEAGDAIVGITFTKPRANPEFTGDQLATFEFLTPHIKRAFGLFANFLAVNREVRVLAEAFDRIPQCVLIVDPEEKVVFANHSGQELLARKDGLELTRDRRLKASSGSDNRELRAALSRALTGDGDNKAHQPESRIRIARPSGQRELELMIAPFHDHNLFSDGSESLGIVFISDTELRAPVEATLGHIHGLTPAESKIASLLANGHSLGEICQLLDIKPNTARTHLKHIFGKTGTNRQSELVKLILSGSGSLR